MVRHQPCLRAAIRELDGGLRKTNTRDNEDREDEADQQKQLTSAQSLHVFA
jgi:hypothetical protein